jgi:hypothetical protein
VTRVISEARADEAYGIFARAADGSTPCERDLDRLGLNTALRPSRTNLEQATMMPRTFAAPNPALLPSKGPRVINPGRWGILPDTSDGYEWFPPMLPRLMVPLQGARYVTLVTPAQGPVAITNASDSGIVSDWLGQACCRAILRNKMLTVYGMNRPCRISIDLQQGDSRFSIMVTLKESLEVPTIAHYVEHGPLRKTRMTPAMLREMIVIANGILEPQANVKIVLKTDSVLRHEVIGAPLGRVVTDIPQNENDECSRLTTHAIRDGRPHLLNLFLVRRFETEGSNPVEGSNPDGGRADDLAGTANGCCIFEDQIRGGRLDGPSAGQTLAHEVGHHLDLLDLYGDGDTESLMYYRASADRDRISAEEADKMNKAGVPSRP